MKNRGYSKVIRGGSRTATTSKVELFVIIVNGWKPLTIIIKSFTFGLLADSVVKLSIEIDIFIKHPKS